MLCLLFTLFSLAVCSATKPTNSTLLQSVFGGSVSALNRSATELYGKFHDALAQNPGTAEALKNQTLDTVRDELLRLAQRNVTLNSPACANVSHLPIRKCLHKSDAKTARELRNLVKMQKFACDLGLPSLTNSFENSVGTCFDVQDSSCAAKAIGCLQNLTQELDTQLFHMLTQPTLHKRDNTVNTTAAQPAQPTLNATALLQSDRKHTTQAVIIGTAAVVVTFFWFMISGGNILAFLPLVFITVMLALDGKHLAELNHNALTVT